LSGFGAQVLVFDRFLFEAFDHLGYSAAVLVAGGAEDVNLKRAGAAAGVHLGTATFNQSLAF